MKDKKNKKDKRKVVYIDDGSTVADMSQLYGSAPKKNGRGHRSSLKEQLQTYFSTVKLMLLPMLITMGVISLAFLLVYLLLSLA